MVVLVKRYLYRRYQRKLMANDEFGFNPKTGSDELHPQSDCHENCLGHRLANDAHETSSSPRDRYESPKESYDSPSPVSGTGCAVLMVFPLILVAAGFALLNHF